MELNFKMRTMKDELIELLKIIVEELESSNKKSTIQIVESNNWRIKIEEVHK